MTELREGGWTTGPWPGFVTPELDAEHAALCILKERARDLLAVLEGGTEPPHLVRARLRIAAETWARAERAARHGG